MDHLVWFFGERVELGELLLNYVIGGIELGLVVLAIHILFRIKTNVVIATIYYVIVSFIAVIAYYKTEQLMSIVVIVSIILYWIFLRTNIIKIIIYMAGIMAIGLYGTFCGNIANIMVEKILLSLGYSMPINNESMIIFSLGELIGIPLLVVFIRFMTLKVFKRKFEIDKVSKILIVVCLIVFFGLASTFIYFANKGVIVSPLEYVLSILLLLFVAGITIMTLYNNGSKKSEIQHNKLQLAQLNDYLTNVETMNNDMRTFKHDYKNILATMNGYLIEDDIVGLKDLFNEHIIPYEERIDHRLKEINNLTYLGSIELKGLLSFKLSQAIEKNLNVKIGMYEKVQHINLDVIDLCRVIGILVDNAVEASELSENRKLNVIINETEEAVIIAVENSYKGKIESVSRLFESGYTTKENHSGLGLASVRKVLDKHELMLETDVSDELVSQVLCIPN